MTWSFHWENSPSPKKLELVTMKPQISNTFGFNSILYHVIQILSFSFYELKPTPSILLSFWVLHTLLIDTKNYISTLCFLSSRLTDKKKNIGLW